ncbi:MAG TPA: DUF4332 domain-containing protein [Planctomycetota bacterium]
MANMKIDEIEGIGPSYSEKLRSADIVNTDKLLEACCNKAGRETVAEATGIPETMVLKWTNMADLFRLKDVGPEFAELLKASGVDTVKELKHRNAENLATKMAEVNAEKKLARRVPSAEVITGWIAQAAELPAVITH